MEPLVILHHSKIGDTGEMKALFDEKPTKDDMLKAAESVGLFGDVKAEGMEVESFHTLPLREGEEGLCRMRWVLRLK